MKIFLQRWLLVIGSTTVMWAVSERVFWSMWRPGEHIGESFITFVMYGLATYTALVTLDYFKVTTLPGVILVGALYGWITEGIIAMTLFGLGGIPLPFSVSWTALAWHMPFSVVLLWWLHHQALSQSFMRSVTYAGLFGIAWGLWSMTWFFEAEPVVTSVVAFAAHSSIIVFLMMIGHRMLGMTPRAEFQTPRLERYFIFSLLALFCVFITIPTFWYAAIILPLLGLAIFLPLRRMHKDTNFSSSGVLETVTRPVSLRNLSTMILVPGIATGMYALMLLDNFPLFPINYLVLVLTSLGGCVLFGWAVYKIYYVPAA